MTPPNTATALLPDGRRVSYAEYGDPAGERVVIHLHGAGSCRFEAEPFDAAARARGVRIIAPDRPGVGESELPLTTVTGYARDLAGLADALGIGRFVISGVSAGGMYAMATATMLPDRVAGVVPINSATPVADRAARRGVSLSGRMAYRVIQWAPGLVVRSTSRTGGEGRPATAPRSGPDRALLSGHELQELRARIAAERKGPAYLRAEMAGTISDWGFDHRAVARPVVMFTGTRDVGRRYAEQWASALPDARLETLPGGHLGFFSPDWADRIVEAAAGLGDR